MNTPADLEAIVSVLDGLIKDNSERISLVVETGYDETGMVGTRDAYLRLARQVILFVAAAEQGKRECWDIYGKQLPGSSTDISDVFDRSCEVTIDSVCLTESEDQSRHVSDDFRRGSPKSSA